LQSFIEGVLRTSIPILPYDQTAADWHAAQRARLGQQGKTPSFVDGQIASIAWAENLVLVTRNHRHFREFEGLHVEDWEAPTGAP